jgi:hypothetical protein
VNPISNGYDDIIHLSLLKIIIIILLFLIIIYNYKILIIVPNSLLPFTNME